MGGRGGSSGLSTASAQQQRKMNNIKRSIAKNADITSPVKFSKNADGTISYRFVETKRYAREHGGKMISPEKADTVEKTTIKTGTIAKDGLIKKNRDETTEVILKRGRLPRRRR